MHKNSLLVILVLVAIQKIVCQSPNEKSHIIAIIETHEKINIDGVLDEIIWSKTPVANQFFQNRPIDAVPADAVTEVRLCYNDKSIFVSAICYDNLDYVINTLKRDQFGSSDEFAVLIDPQSRHTNGFGFGVNALGAQTEALMQGNTGGDESWDNKWFSAVTQLEDRWIVEMEIPFKALRYNSNNESWSINFVRTDPGLNQTHCWAPVPRQFDVADLGYFGVLKWNKAPASQGKNISFQPYATFKMNKTKGDDINNKFDVGGDAKIGLSPSLNLDLTVNPDFSQVEVDQQVTNLTRFNIFFPERRQFFIENGDIFTGFGLDADQLFYSRRIGLDDFGNTIPILYGVRMSGNISPKSRVGLFNMHARDSKSKIGNNYSAIAMQQSIGQRSSIKGIFLNRQSYLGSEAADDYGRNAGVSYNLSTDNGKWSSYGGYLHSFKQGFTNKNNQKYLGVNYAGTNLQVFIEAQHIGKNFYNDMGFNGRLENYDAVNDEIIRIGYTSIGSMIDYNYYPSNSKSVNVHWSGLENFGWINDDETGLNEWYTRLRHFIIFKNSSELRFRLNNNYLHLLYPFPLASSIIEKGKYNNTEFNIQYNSDTRKIIQGSIFTVYGGFFGGTKFTNRINLLLRAQPWGNFSLGLEDNNIKLTDFKDAQHITLATSRIEINFSTSLFWTTFLQYNTQNNNFNVNSRIQYRYAPMSDLYLVFTDNYDTETTLINKNKSLVLKLNYWLGI